MRLVVIINSGYVTHKIRNMCVPVPAIIRAGKKPGYKVILCRVVRLIKVSRFIYITTHRNKANNAGCKFKGALYIIWCVVNRLGDSGVKVV